MLNANIIIKRKDGEEELWHIDDRCKMESGKNIGVYAQDNTKKDGYFKGRACLSYVFSIPEKNHLLELEWYFYFSLRSSIIEAEGIDLPCMDVVEWFKTRRPMIYKTLTEDLDKEQ